MALSAFELCEETFGMSRDDLESIIAFLRSAESRQMSHSDVEKLVRERSYELSRKLFQAHVDSRGPGEAAAPVRGADGVERDQERIHERGLTTIFGEIRVKRFGYGAEGADSLHPLDAELNLPRERYSFELRRTAAVEVSKGALTRRWRALAATLGRRLESAKWRSWRVVRQRTSTPSMGSALHRQAIAAPRCWRSRRTARAL